MKRLDRALWYGGGGGSVEKRTEKRFYKKDSTGVNGIACRKKMHKTNAIVMLLEHAPEESNTILLRTFKLNNKTFKGTRK